MLGRGEEAWDGGGEGGGVHMEAIPFPRVNKWRHIEGGQGRVPLSRCRQGGVGRAEEVGVGVEGGTRHNTEGVVGEEEEGAGVVGGEEEEEEEEEDKQMGISKTRSSKTRGSTCWRAGRHNLL
ncbi:unnamed protein product, partial [Ectocarpus sp. 8 AP-2014]